MKKFNHVWAITAHGESPYLEECIRSIKSQTVQTDVILCTATDNELIRKLSVKYDIPVYVKTGRDDVRENWNFAYNSADGNWVTLAHQDDLYESTYVEELIKHAEGVHDAAIFHTNYRPFGNASKGAMLNKRIKSIINIPLLAKCLSGSKLVKGFILAIGNGICCPTVSYNKEFLGMDIFLKADQNDIHENLDWEMWIWLARQKNKFLYTSKELLKCRFHEEQITAIYINNNRRVMEDIKCLSLIWPKPIAKFIMIFYKKAYNIYE